MMNMKIDGNFLAATIFRQKKPKTKTKHYGLADADKDSQQPRILSNQGKHE